MRAYTHNGSGTPAANQHNILDSNKMTISAVFLSSWRRRGSNLLSLDLESDALPTSESPPLSCSPCLSHKWIGRAAFFFGFDKRSQVITISEGKRTTPGEQSIRFPSFSSHSMRDRMSAVNRFLRQGSQWMCIAACTSCFTIALYIVRPHQQSIH